jgi:hypothetical protein
MDKINPNASRAWRRHAISTSISIALVLSLSTPMRIPLA